MIKLASPNVKSGLTVGELLCLGFLEEVLLSAYLFENKLISDELAPAAVASKLAQTALVKIESLPIKTDIEKLTELNRLWIDYLEVADLAARAFAFTQDYQQLLQSKGNNFWHQVVAAVKPWMSNLMDAERVCEILFCYKLELAKTEQERLVNDPQLYLKTLLVLAQLNDSLSELILAEDTNTLSYETIRKIISKISKSEQTVRCDIAQITKLDIEKAVALCLCGHPDLNLLKALLPFIEHEYIVGRASELLLGLTKKHGQ